MDELRRIRELAEQVPDPDPRRKAQARSELLELAEAEQEATTPLAEPEATTPLAEPGHRRRLAELLDTWRRTLLRPAPAVGLATLALVAVVGTVGLLTGPGGDPSTELVDPGHPPEAPVAPDPGAPDEQPEPAIELAASCTDPEERVTVAYPDTWHTPERGDPGACRFFGEEAFDVDAAIGGAPLAPLEIVVVPAPFDEAAEPGAGSTEVEREAVAVGGHTAVRQRLEATGEAALPEGVFVERVLVDLGGDTLVLTMQDEDPRALDDRWPLLEEMVRAVELHDDR